MKTASFRLAGPWVQGFVLDVHTLGSVYLGDDEFGHPIFETTRSELGDLLYRLKYQSDLGGLPQLVEAVTDFARKWGFQPDVLLPVPPSNAGRAVRPVYLIAEAVATKLGVAWDRDALVERKRFPN